MAKSVLIIVGHQNIQSLTSQALRSWRSVSTLRASTGGNNEMVYYRDQIAPRLANILRAAGLEVTVTDAIYHQNIYARDYDACIILHDDGAGDENRCMSSAPLRGVVPAYLNNPALDASERLSNLWNNVFPSLTGTIFRANRITAGMRENYVFDYIGMNTPTVLVEHCNRDSELGKNLRANPDTLANADAQVLFQFLGVSQQPASQVNELSTQIEKLKGQIGELQGQVNRLTDKLNQIKAIIG